ncbi:MAG: hypothetical protein JWO31_83 [Phycisphaerales bacterium]|nr:hypothetical protein [Phycisphaerales bacterium]
MPDPTDYANPAPPAPVEAVPPPAAPASSSGLVIALVFLSIVVVGLAAAAFAVLGRQRAADTATRTATAERSAVLDCLGAVQRVRADLADGAGADVVLQHLGEAESSVRRAKLSGLSPPRRDQVDRLGLARDSFRSAVIQKSDALRGDANARLAKVEAELAAE